MRRKKRYYVARGVGENRCYVIKNNDIVFENYLEGVRIGRIIQYASFLRKRDADRFANSVNKF
ncbi:hypothetical protein LCGC14_0232630 [marine sediment metagenome]|uniref:Uncharacterized protein n=1 Tax=marine sediment metagenome TaxID=412755 RepID=A0A0F9URK0_9ZZZZ